jgi:pyridoxal phosphate enzyme (YggS family)
MTRAHQISSALDDVRTRIAEAAARAGRSGDSVRLIAVSKKMPVEDVQAALAAGQQDFGESYAQELRDKRAALERAASGGLGQAPAGPGGTPRRPRWHYLGPIQSNKVKYLAGQVELIQSLDDAAVLSEIDRRMAPAAAGGDPELETRRQGCLVQVNVAGEARKGGVPPHRLGELLDHFATSRHAVCLGLMLIPPLSDDAGATRRHFASLRAMAERQKMVARPNVTLTELSMGMSSDFTDAVAEGATIVRVGTAIFGARTPL